MNSSLHPLQFSEVLLKSQLKDEGNSTSLYIFLTIDSWAFTSPFKFSWVSTTLLILFPLQIIAPRALKKEKLIKNIIKSIFEYTSPPSLSGMIVVIAAKRTTAKYLNFQNRYSGNFRSIFFPFRISGIFRFYSSLFGFSGRSRPFVAVLKLFCLWVKAPHWQNVRKFWLVCKWTRLFGSVQSRLPV